jgi:hypothetical protein
MSKLVRPADHLLERFHAGQAGEDRIADYLANGWSLAICCKACPRIVEWTPPELAQRFGERHDLRIADLAVRLACTGEGECGARDIAVFPHLYDGLWSWPAPDS